MSTQVYVPLLRNNPYLSSVELTLRARDSEGWTRGTPAPGLELERGPVQSTYNLPVWGEEGSLHQCNEPQHLSPTLLTPSFCIYDCSCSLLAGSPAFILLSPGCGWMDHNRGPEELKPNYGSQRV